MIQVLNINDEIQRVVREALARAEHAEGKEGDGLETLTALQNEFPQATIGILSLADLLQAVHESTQGLDE